MAKYDYESSRHYTNEYFEKQLDSLGLSTKSIERHHGEKALHNSLAVVNDAIENHESFGKIDIRVPSENGEIIGIKQNETLIKVGILPLLLERKKLILEQLEQYGNRKIKVDDNVETNQASIRDELTKIARGEVNRRLWIFISFMVAAWIGIFLLIQTFGWNVLEPWTYLIGVGLVIVGYIYFAIQQREFSPPAIYQHALEARKKQLFHIFGVDEE